MTDQPSEDDHPPTMTVALMDNRVIPLARYFPRSFSPDYRAMDAHDRAINLLFDWLSEEQRQQVEQVGAFVVGDFIINIRSTVINVWKRLLSCQVKHIPYYFATRYCLRFAGDLRETACPSDIFLAEKLLLENDPDLFLSVAESMEAVVAIEVVRGSPVRLTFTDPFRELFIFP